MTPPATRTRPHLNNPVHGALPAPVGVGSTAARGNRTTRTTGGVATTYAYDPANRLVGVSGTTAIGYTYDGDGYRVGATIDPTDPIAYTWDRLGLGGLGQIIADDTGENVFGPAGLQQRVSTAGTAQYAHGDGLGSLRLVTDASGAAVGSATYEPWGAPRAGSATLGGYGFTGELTDAETGFVYLRARYLDPGTGRFITQDTYPGTPGSPMSQHRFAYGNDNPLSYTDPSGHFVIGAGAAVVWAFAAVGITVTAPVAAAIAAVIGVTILIQCFRMGPCLGWVKALAAQVSAGVLSACAFAGALHAQWQQGWATIGSGGQYQVSQSSGSTLPTPAAFPAEYDASKGWKQVPCRDGQSARKEHTCFDDPDGGHWHYDADNKSHNAHWDRKPPPQYKPTKDGGQREIPLQKEEIPINNLPIRKPGFEK